VVVKFLLFCENFFEEKPENMCSNKTCFSTEIPHFYPQKYIFLNENENEKKILNIDKWKKKIGDRQILEIYIYTSVVRLF